MKWVGVIVLILMSFSAYCVPRDSARVAERKLAKIDRQKKRIEKKWDERSIQQKSKDRRAVLFIVISAGILVNSMAHRE